eukprot:scaffold243479_cov15-Tisochrysis_lutea.AAC.1
MQVRWAVLVGHQARVTCCVQKSLVGQLAVGASIYLKWNTQIGCAFGHPYWCAFVPLDTPTGCAFGHPNRCTFVPLDTQTGVPLYLWTSFHQKERGGWGSKG